MDPTCKVFGNPVNGNYFRDQSWKVLKKLASKDKKWKRTESLENQYYCHVAAAKKKTPWNIEPHRKNKGYWGFIKSGCN